MILLLLRIFIFFFSVCIIICRNRFSDQPTISSDQTVSYSISKTDARQAYAVLSDFEKSQLYFYHRMDIVLHIRYPNLKSWSPARQGVSLLNQAIEVILFFPDNIQSRIWISSQELIGQLYIKKEEILPADLSDETIPNELREFFDTNTGIIGQKIRTAVKKHLTYAYFCFENGESDDMQQRICDHITATMDGVMCTVQDNCLSMNVQNMLDDGNY